MARCLKCHASVLILMACALNLRAGSTPGDGAASFRSELWRMEYHAESEQQNESGSEPKADGESRLVQNSNAALQKKDTVRTDHQGEPELVTPGEMQPAELDRDTPFADWQVDAEAAGEARPSVGEPTAWELSRASGFRQGLSTEVAKGPSAITFAVAIIACIVVVGAVFSGRE